MKHFLLFLKCFKPREPLERFTFLIIKFSAVTTNHTNTHSLMMRKDNKVYILACLRCMGRRGGWGVDPYSLANTQGKLERQKTVEQLFVMTKAMAKWSCYSFHLSPCYIMFSWHYSHSIFTTRIWVLFFCFFITVLHVSHPGPVS